MKKNHYLFIRTLKKVDFSVFCVDVEQKTYYDKTFGVRLPYSSGQQVKRSILESILDYLNLPHTPLIFNYRIEKNDLKQKEIEQPCDPTYFDQLLGGWMSVPENDKKKKRGESNDEEKDKTQYKRRSPFAISAMTALHPLLGGVNKEENMTFDRTNVPDDKIIVKKVIDNVDVILSEEEIKEFIENQNKKISKNKFISGTNKVNGIYKSDIAIDLRRLFSVTLSDYDLQISDETYKKLKENGWKEIIDPIHGKMMFLPEDKHEMLAEAIAYGILNWRITSNQSRTFDYMPIISVGISTNANEIPNSIRAELCDGEKHPNVIIDSEYPNTKIFSTEFAKGYIKNIETQRTAIDDAFMYIKTSILNYYKDEN